MSRYSNQVNITLPLAVFLATDVFDDEKFTQLGGGSSSNFTVDLENEINLTPTLTNVRNGYVRETYNCTLQQNGEYETLVAGTELTNIPNNDYKVYGVSCDLINYPSSDIHTIDYLLPSNFANGELKLNHCTLSIYMQYNTFTTRNGLNGNNRNMVIVFEGIFEPENDGVFSVGFAGSVSSFVYMKKGSYLELEEIN